MKTKLIIIRGNANTGKSTVAACVHNLLVDMYKLEDKPIPLDDEACVSTFHSNLVVEGRSIAVISEGDREQKLKEQIDDAKSRNANIIVTCLRSKNRKGSSCRMMMTDYPELYNESVQVWTSFSTDKSMIIPLKKAVAEVIVNIIVKLIK